MKLNEIISDELKPKYRELSKKFHPDKGGDSKTMERINNAVDKGDEAFQSIYKELTGKKIDIPISLEKLRDLQEEWAKDLEQNKNEKIFIYEIYPKLEKNSITIIIRFRCGGEVKLIIKNSERFKTKNDFITNVKKLVELKYNKHWKKYIYNVDNKIEEMEKLVKIQNEWAKEMERLYNLKVKSDIITGPMIRIIVTRKNGAKIMISNGERFKTKNNFTNEVMRIGMEKLK